MKRLKGIFAGSPALPQFFILLSAVLAGIVLLSCISLLSGYTAGGISVNRLRLYQLLSEVCVFLLPAWLAAWLCSRRPLSYLSVKRVTDVQVWGLTFVSMFLLSPFITLTGFLNAQMKLPACLYPVEEWMQALESSAREMTDLLLTGSEGLTVVFNLVVIAVGAGVGEEFFFRGAFRRILGRKIRNPHALIWIVAALFSLIHLQFYGFIPRLLLGAYFGYLVYWSRSIWLAVFAHFINNAVAVIGMSQPSLKDKSYISGEIAADELLFFVLLSFAGLFFFAICLHRLYRRLKVVPA
ncbi:MAG: CPBP family intramembrane metalloprotease [Tannerellaceae bacterium]|jgi:membrane protease YdiL (CAAX protease family)|nr:CPBP family intramembrane metalloprotease [Tannerellaceae bacterium]